MDKDEGFAWVTRGFGLFCFIAGMALRLGGSAGSAADSGALVQPVMFAAWTGPALFIAAWLLIGGDVILRAIRNILRGRIFDENFLMTAATIGAFAIGEYPEGAAVMLFYQVGEAFQDLAVRRSRSSITALMDLRPDYAMLKRDGMLVRVNPEEVQPGDYIVVKPGEKIALDGTVEEGEALLDTSAMTGEPVPRRAGPGSEVLAGMINQSGLLTIRVIREAGESAAAKILTLVKEAEEKKAPVENFITRFARYYTPAVVIAALILAVLPPFLIVFFNGLSPAGEPVSFGILFAEWSRRALVFLVVSCPCALVVSIPLSFFAGIGGASRRGILVKGGNYLDALNRTGTVVFDKTGTLTKGQFTVSRINPAPGFTKDELLRLAALAESNSNHPIALSIRKAAAAIPKPAASIQKPAASIQKAAEEVSSYSEIAGKGVRLQQKNGQTILAGSRALLADGGIPVIDTVLSETSAISGTTVYIAKDSEYAGLLVIADELKPDSKTAVAALTARGIKTVMLSGDSAETAAAVAAEAGIDEVHAELLPWEKVDKLEELKQGAKALRNKVVFVGDGINDAPVLAASDIGIAMGGLGSDAAIESADIVLMTDEPSRLIEAMAAAKKTIRKGGRTARIRAAITTAGV
ncbi:hypothetical protein AGMMS50230_09560 [Spirochaetia bacterium]|nr:hypothetical protein AGMMS50230_09560 [Spirochaetia bacterium]